MTNFECSVNSTLVSSTKVIPVRPSPVFTVSYEKTSIFFSMAIPLSPSFLSISALPLCSLTLPIEARAELEITINKIINQQYSHILKVL
jgi:hypothetical protein